MFRVKEYRKNSRSDYYEFVWHGTPYKKIIIHSIGFLLGSFSKSSFLLFAFFVCLIVCLIHLLCNDLPASNIQLARYNCGKVQITFDHFFSSLALLFDSITPHYGNIWRANDEKKRENTMRQCLFLFEMYHFVL